MMYTNSLLDKQILAKRFTLYPERGKGSVKRNDLKWKQTGHSPRSLTYNTIIERIRGLVEAHIDDEQYGIDELCRDACISRSNLHKKLKALTGLSTSLFIRVIKLRRAQELLKNTDLNISQVAYEIGFKDPTYFSKVFSQSFNISPKDYRKRTTLVAGIIRI